MSGRRRRQSKIILIVVLVSLFIIGMVLGMVIISIKSSKEIAAVQEELDRTIEEQSAITVVNVYQPKRERRLGAIPINPYDPDRYGIDNGFKAYFDENGNKISHLGVDLSYHNQNIDWDELAASPVEFVMLRCGYRGYTEGGLVEDEKFREYAAEANRVGLKLGVYFFTQAISVEEAEAEAEFVAELIEDYDISYPVAFDTEDISSESARTNTNEISNELRSQMCDAFCKTIASYGYYPMIYSSENWMRRKMNLEALQDYDFWAAQYVEENDFLYDFTMWQYTADGNVPGVKESVDIDISMVDYSSFVPSMQEALETGGKIMVMDENGAEIVTE